MFITNFKPSTPLPHTHVWCIWPLLPSITNYWYLLYNFQTIYSLLLWGRVKISDPRSKIMWKSKERQSESHIIYRQVTVRENTYIRLGAENPANTYCCPKGCLQPICTMWRYSHHNMCYLGHPNPSFTGSLHIFRPFQKSPPVL